MAEAILSEAIGAQGERKLAYTTKEAASLLGVNKNAVCNYISHGMLQGARIGRHTVIRSEWIEDFLDKTSSYGPLSSTKEGIAADAAKWERLGLRVGQARRRP